MRAVVIHAPKDLRIDNYPDTVPGPGEVRVKIANGGICGSDLHYYHHGGFGTVRIQQPMALGHEIAGVVAAVGDGVGHLKAGTRVAVNPSKPCGQCLHCREGMRNQCLDMRFMGSAMRNPHVQGGFREYVTVDAPQAVPIAERLSLAEAAMAEPLAVCLHAGKQAGPLLGKRVLITGCGPIGALIRQVLTHRIVVPSEFGPHAPSWATMALLFAADRLDHIEAEIAPILRDGVTVLCDRYDLSSLAYQSATSPAEEGAETDAVVGWIREVNRRARRPDLTIVLDVSPAVAAKRRRQRGRGAELYEDLEVQDRLALAYRDAEKLVPGDRVVHVDADRPPEAVLLDAAAALAALPH